MKSFWQSAFLAVIALGGIVDAQTSGGCDTVTVTSTSYVNTNGGFPVYITQTVTSVSVTTSYETETDTVTQTQVTTVHDTTTQTLTQAPVAVPTTITVTNPVTIVGSCPACAPKTVSVPVTVTGSCEACPTLTTKAGTNCPTCPSTTACPTCETTITIISRTTSVPPPVTVPVSVRIHVTDYVIISQTIVNSRTIFTTITSQDTAINIVTAVVTVTALTTVTAQNTVVVTAQCSTTVAAPAPVATLTGLVTCTSRIVNPTYTPASALPSNYHWGCPPGYICTPTQDGCNFEQGPPADTYFCPPDQCQPAGALPPLSDIIALVNQGPMCAWLTPPTGYFNLNPIPWGLSYSIFNIFGQPTCAASSAPSTWQGWTTSTYVPQPVTTVNTWQQWSSQDTARAEMPKQLKKPAEAYPKTCYQLCNHAAQVYQSIGNDAGLLCPPSGAFSSAVAALNSCSSAYSTQLPDVQVTALNDAFALCNAALAMSAAESVAPTTIKTTPAAVSNFSTS